MKPFTAEQKELNCLILNALALLRGGQNASSSEITKRLLYQTRAYTLQNVTGRLRALKNRGIVSFVASMDIDVESGYPIGYWSLTDKGRQAYTDKNWSITGN